MSSLEIRDLNLYKCVHDRKIKLIDSLNLTLREGEIHVIYGEFGSGKSVLANLIAGYIKPSWSIEANTIRINDVNLMDSDGFVVKRVKQSDVGVILQRPQDIIDSQIKIGVQLVKTLKIGFKGSFYKYFGWKTRYISGLMHRLGIKDPTAIMDSYLSDLSSAEKHIIMSVFGLLNKPKLIIVDEPNNAVSHGATEKILNYLYSLNQNQGITILFLTSDYDMIHDYVNRASFLYRGQLVETINQTDDIIKQVKHPYSLQYLRTRVDFIKPIPFQSMIPVVTIGLDNIDIQLQGCRFGNACKFSQAKCSKLPSVTRSGQQEYYCHYPINVMYHYHKGRYQHD